MRLELDKTTDYDCSYCANSKLTPKRDSNRKLTMINGLSPEHRVYHEKAYEGDEKEIHACALVLECTNPKCQIVTIVAGRLDAIPEYDDMLREYETTFTPYFFYPPVNIVPIPHCVPETIRKEIQRSYALFFADPASAANPLRSAIECFMDEASVQKERNGKELTLHARLTEFQKTNLAVAELLGAVKWLGNDGSHYGHGLTHDDLVKGYRVFLHAAEKWFDDPEARVKTDAAHISKGRTLTEPK